MSYWWNKFTEDGEGFTLVELMIVVAIIGILAAIAIPQFMESVQNAKSAEAEQIMKKMVDGSAGYFTKEQKRTPSSGPEPWHSGASVNKGEPVSFSSYVFPGGGTNMSVLSSPPEGGTKQSWGGPANNTEEAIVKWHGLSIEDPLYYQYEYRNAGSGSTAIATVIAEADFDQQGTPNEEHIQTMSVSNGEPQKGSAYTKNTGK